MEQISLRFKLLLDVTRSVAFRFDRSEVHVVDGLTKLLATYLSQDEAASVEVDSSARGCIVADLFLLLNGASLALRISYVSRSTFFRLILHLLSDRSAVRLERHPLRK